MQSFEFQRAADAPAAVAAGAKSKTAQQGADVRFLAGGTTLIDLMKLNVERPQRVVDINRLPFDKIEKTPDQPQYITTETGVGYRLRAL